MRCFVSAALLLTTFSGIVVADTFEIINRQRQNESFEGRILGSGNGMLAIVRPDGTIRQVPRLAVRNRKPGEMKPLTGKQVNEALQKRFGKDLYTGVVHGDFVIALIAAKKLSRRELIRSRALMKKATRFMANVAAVFTKFAKKMDLPLKDPEFPLVLLVFESDEDFEKYASDTRGGVGLSAKNVAGFYAHTTNWLAVRLSSCEDFSVPLHEAIHQQVFNRGIFNRLAALPTWFNEGIATGFEGNGDKIKNTPQEINIHYARRIAEANARTPLKWELLVADDRAFRGNVLVGEAYTQAWALHWMLVTHYPKQYSAYIKKLHKRETLGRSSTTQRVQEFRDAFGATPAEIQQKFPQALKKALVAQRVKLTNERPGITRKRRRLGEVVIRAAELNGRLLASGQLLNISPIRDMSFYVAVVTEGGVYCDWYFPRVGFGKKVTLRQQSPRKLLPGARGSRSTRYRVVVFSAVPGTEQAKRWEKGQLPIPR